MEQLSSIFKDDLGIVFHEFPYLTQPALPKRKGNKVFVNRAISGLTQKVFHHAGWHQTSNIKEAKMIWGRQLDDFDFSHINKHTKINHFFHAFLIGRKDEFHKRMLEYHEKNKKQIDGYPISFLLPQEKEELMKIYHSFPYWISKPAAASSGKGIKLFPSTIDPPITRGIVQQYIDPYLINNKKFDFRLYFMVTSISPMKIYMFNDGLVRFCTEDYDVSNLYDVFSHLTNYSVNKSSLTYTQKKDENIANTKWSLKFFIETMKNQIDIGELLKNIEITCTRVILLGQSTIRNQHLKTNRSPLGSFELYGVDVLLDKDLKPYVIEVNVSPSMEGGQSKMDSTIKTTLLSDAFNMALIPDEPNDTFTLLENELDSFSKLESTDIKKCQNSLIPELFTIFLFNEEINRKGNFHLVFPSKENIQNYNTFEPMYSDNFLSKWISFTKEEQDAFLSSSFSLLREQLQLLMKQGVKEDGESDLDSSKNQK